MARHRSSRSRSYKATNSKKARWPDQHIRENSVVRRFGPKSNAFDHAFPESDTIRNILSLVNIPVKSDLLLDVRDNDRRNSLEPLNPGSPSSTLSVATPIPVRRASLDSKEGFLSPRRVEETLVPNGEVRISIENDHQEEREILHSLTSPETSDTRPSLVPEARDVTLPNLESSQNLFAENVNTSNVLPVQDLEDEGPDDDPYMRGVASQKFNVDGCESCCNEENVELSSVSYLTVPEDNRRPSTADLVIEKLKVEKVEGGGLSIQGVALASHCHITLCVFGAFFLVAGLILSYISFNVSAISEQTHEELGPLNEDNSTSTTSKPSEQVVTSVMEMRRIGPSFIAVGLVMLILGVAFFALVKKISRDEKVHRLIISEQQLNQLASSFSHDNATTSPMHTLAPAPHEQYPILSVRRNSWWVDPTPVESNTNPDACDFAMQCPTPLGDNQGITSPPSVSPVPSETRGDRRESYADIACFPAPPPPTEKINPETASPGGQNQETAGQGPPASANVLLGRAYPAPVPSDNHPSSASHIPHIQVTSANYSTSVPKLPRLSRHCLDSRPTTADSR